MHTLYRKLTQPENAEQTVEVSVTSQYSKQSNGQSQALGRVISVVPELYIGVQSLEVQSLEKVGNSRGLHG